MSRSLDPLRGEDSAALCGLTVKRYAILLARLQGAGDGGAPAILAREALSGEAWSAARAAWSRALADDLECRRPERLRVFTASYREALAESSRARAPVDPRDETVVGGAAIDDPLPFSPAAPRSPPPVVTPATPRHAEAGATRVFRAIDAETLPFVTPGPVATDAPEPGDGRRMELRRFASLEAELASTPRDRAATLRRYDLSEPSYAAYAARWSARFERNVEELAQFQRLLADYRFWLASHGNGGR
jgi:hypothetical protein